MYKLKMAKETSPFVRALYALGLSHNLGVDARPTACIFFANQEGKTYSQIENCSRKTTEKME